MVEKLVFSDQTIVIFEWRQVMVQVIAVFFKENKRSTKGDLS